MTSRRFTALLVPLAIACAPAPEAPDTHTTYWKDAKPVLAARCEGCHTASGIGPFDLSTYATAKGMASSIVAAAQNRTMPPWMPSEAGPKLQHERRLSDAELSTLQKWLEEGTIEGDPATQPPPKTSDIATIEPTMELEMAFSYKPDTSLGTDDYRCFVLDPKLTTDAAVTGFDIKPGNTRIVHHVILFRVAKRNLPALAAEEQKDPAPGYTCFGDAKVDSQMVGAWVPGITATRLPEGTGVVLKAGDKLVMQVHYNMLEDKTGTDQTKAVLELQEAQAVRGAYILPLIQDDFSVAPGEVKTVTGSVDTEEIYKAAQMYYPGSQVVIHGLAPHMHLHGQSIKVSMTPTNGAPQTLIDIPKWDFHWQQFYFFEQAIPLARYASIELSCTFDNRAASQPRINGQPTEPKTLTWGEGTLEEMCLNFFYISFEY